MAKNIRTRNTRMATAAEEVVEDSELEALLAGMEVEASADDEIVEQADMDDIVEIAAATDDEVVIEAGADESVSEEDITRAVSELDLEEARAEAYSEQESEGDVDTTPVKATKAKKVKEPKAPKEFRKTMATSRKSEVITSRLGANSHEFFALEMADADLSEEELKAKQEEMLARIDSIAKKIGEKAVNVISWLAGRAKLSNYTDQAISLLIEKGEITSKDLLEHYKARPYSEGTSRSQSQQLMKLLPEMKVGVMEGKTMKLNPESLIVAKFQEGTGEVAGE